MAVKNSLRSWHKIYVNRALNMASIKSIGFDMDHTLALYHRENFESLAFRETCKKFIEAGYPQELLEIKFDPKFVIRGLLVDTERGNLLKVDSHKYVKTAFHGREKLSKQERHQIYNSESYSTANFVSVDTFFALSEVQLYFEIIDYMRRNPGVIQKSFREVYEDLRNFIDLSHADGSIKTQVMADIDRYIVRDKARFRGISRLVEGGKSVFLLTNSKWDYTEAIMNYIFDDGVDEFAKWRDLFNQVIVGASKPSFFTGTQPFFEVVEGTDFLKSHDGILESGKIYQGGNGRLFQRLTKLKGDEILYCGDHIFGDIIQSKAEFNWRTLLVVEELTDPLKELSAHQDDWINVQSLISERELQDEEVQKLRSRVRNTQRQWEAANQTNDAARIASLGKKIDELEGKLRDYETRVSELNQGIKSLLADREARIHPIWGDPLMVGLEKSRFARQIEEYACLYTTDVGNLRFYSPFKRFHSVHERMPHDF